MSVPDRLCCRVVEEVLVTVRQHIQFLYTVSESLSYLDLMVPYESALRFTALTLSVYAPFPPFRFRLQIW